ncbi:hypothetical protein [Hyphococcus sp.]|uniref:hypothetical protein n=1 Tax=Hyphococcus sp. TaxID=2038636 RepID=UPI00208DA08D|nr:MAG: hypothetical protein DHS20C04_32140 [Marinicaulis sp.]
MSAPWSPTERLDQAALEIEFAIKLLSYFEKGLVQKQEFDCETVVLLNGGSITFENGGFHTPDDLVLGAQNAWSHAASSAALAMEAALTDHGIQANARDVSPQGQMRTLVYMIRCAFAHDSQTPKWEARGAYEQILKFELRGQDVRVDVGALNGRPFDFADIGGELVFWNLLQEVRTWVR